MKTMRKLFAMVLALTMVLAMATTAGAATVTVENALSGVEYKAYQMATVTPSSDGTSYSYISTSDWVNFWTQDAVKNYFTVITDGNNTIVTPVSGLGDTEAAAIAKAAKAFATSLTETAKVTATTAEDPTANFDLADGYYLLTSGGGSLCAVDTIIDGKDVVLSEKNSSLPNVDKKIATADGTETEISAAIGETVTFKLTVNAGENIANEMQYVIHDIMGEGLTLNTDSVKVTLTKAGQTSAENVAFNLVTENITDGCTFEITFTDALTTAVGDTITVTYDATLNENATEENVNTAKIGSSTSEVTVKTYKFTFDKVDGNDVALTGAKFKLYSDAECTQEILVVADGDNAYRVAKNGETGVEIESAGAKITVSGLKEGTYYLKETVAPAGYVLSTEAKTVTVGGAETSNPDFDFVNVKGDELPETGGMGTTLFYIVGGLMVAGAAILLVTKKRMGAAE